MKFLRKINLEINKDLYNPIQVKQGDNSRYLLFNLLDNGVPFDLSNKTVRVYAVKPDATKIFNNLTIVDAENGLAELQLTSQMLAKAGWLKLELVIYEATDILSTIKFDIDIIASIRDDEAIESTNEFSALTVALAKADEYGEALKQGTENIELIYATELNGVKSHLEDIAINVKSFGAKGDGISDDTLCIQNAINSIKDTGGKIYFTVGDYLISDTLILYDNICLCGALRGGVDSKVSRIIRAIDVPILNMNNLKNNMLENMSLIDKVNSIFTSPAVILESCYMFNFNNVFFSNTGKNILFKNRNFDSRLTNCFFGKSNSFGAIEFVDAPNGRDGCNEINFINCHWEHYTNTALIVGAFNHDIRFSGCKFESIHTTTQKIIIIKGGQITFNNACTINFSNLVDCCVELDNAEVFSGEFVFTTTDILTNILNPLIKCNGNCSYNLKLYNANISVDKYVPTYIVFHQNESNNYITSNFVIQSNFDTQYFINGGKRVCNIAINRIYIDIPQKDISNIQNRSGIPTNIEDIGSFIEGRITNQLADIFNYSLTFKQKDGSIKNLFSADSNGNRFEIPKYLKLNSFPSEMVDSKNIGFIEKSDPNIGFQFVIGCSIGTNKQLRVSTGNTIPTQDSFYKGDIIFNSLPSAGGVLGWVCTESGTPGVWKSFGQISSS